MLKQVAQSRTVRIVTKIVAYKYRLEFTNVSLGPTLLFIEFSRLVMTFKGIAMYGGVKMSIRT